MTPTVLKKLKVTLDTGNDLLRQIDEKKCEIAALVESDASHVDFNVRGVDSLCHTGQDSEEILHLIIRQKKRELKLLTAQFKELK